MVVLHDILSDVLDGGLFLEAIVPVFLIFHLLFFSCRAFPDMRGSGWQFIELLVDLIDSAVVK